MADLLSSFEGETTWSIIKKIVEHMPASIGVAIDEDPKKAMRIMERALRAELHPKLDWNQFRSVVSQIGRMSELNRNYIDWCFSDEDFLKAMISVPAWPKSEDRNDRIALVLVPYFPDTPVYRDLPVESGYRRTLRALLQELCNSGQLDFPGVTLSLNAMVNCIDLVKSTVYRPGLRWEAINFSANRNTTPNEVMLRQEALPSAGVLAAAILHPEWFERLDGEKEPFVWLPGYSASKVYGEETLLDLIPNLRRQDDGAKAIMSFGNRDCREMRMAIPAFVPTTPWSLTI